VTKLISSLNDLTNRVNDSLKLLLLGNHGSGSSDEGTVLEKI
jgi:hypothetical protein